MATGSAVNKLSESLPEYSDWHKTTAQPTKWFNCEYISWPKMKEFSVRCEIE